MAAAEIISMSSGDGDRRGEKIGNWNVITISFFFFWFFVGIEKDSYQG